MRRPILLSAFVASLVANICLLGRWHRGTAPVPPASLPSPAGSAPPPAAPWLIGQAAPIAIPTTDAEIYALRTRLETLGLPPEIIRIALAVSVQRAFQKRREALFPQPGPNEYWRNPTTRPDLADPTALRELEREQRKMTRELIGDDFDLDDTAQRRQFAGLSAEKIARLQKIFSDYSDLEEQLYVDGSDRVSAENRARAALLAQEKRRDIERALTLDELRNYDLRNSPAAHRLRGQLGQFAATEAEFVALYPTFKAVMDETGASAINQRGNAVEVRRARETAERQLDAALQRVLGDARYAEMKEANDQLLQQTRAFTSSLNLPPAVAAEVIAVQREFSPKLAAVDRDRELSPNQRDAQTSALGLAARDRLIRALGPENFEAYKRRGGGWLGAALSRAPPTPTPAP